MEGTVHKTKRANSPQRSRMGEILKIPICGCFHKEKRKLLSFIYKNFHYTFSLIPFLASWLWLSLEYATMRNQGKKKPECAKNFRNIEKKKSQ